jgi:hypothetical protein
MLPVSLVGQEAQEHAQDRGRYAADQIRFELWIFSRALPGHGAEQQDADGRNEIADAFHKYPPISITAVQNVTVADRFR